MIKNPMNDGSHMNGATAPPARSKAEAEVDLGRLSPSARLKHSSLKLLLEASIGADPLPMATKREKAMQQLQQQPAVTKEKRLMPKRKWASDTAPARLSGVPGPESPHFKRPKAEFAVPPLLSTTAPPKLLRGIASGDGFDDSLIVRATIMKSKVREKSFVLNLAASDPHCPPFALD